MKKYQVKHFTLIELLAAMAVFSVLLLISMRLFSGAQQLWLRSEQKTNTFADARLAMEFVASRMQSFIYEEDWPFYIENHNSTDQIWFPSRLPMGNGYANNSFGRRYFQFMLVDPLKTSGTGYHEDAGKLRLRYYNGSNDKKFGWIFSSYNENNRYFKEADDAFDHVKGKFDGSLDEEYEIDIVENVISFDLVWYDGKYNESAGANDSKWELKKSTAANSKTPPYLVEVEIRMLDSKDSFEKWQQASTSAGKDEVFAEFGYTFRRAILLGKKEVQP